MGYWWGDGRQLTVLILLSSKRVQCVHGVMVG